MPSPRILRDLPALALAALTLAPTVNTGTLVDITFGPQGGGVNADDYGILGTTSAGTFDMSMAAGSVKRSRAG